MQLSAHAIDDSDSEKGKKSDTSRRRTLLSSAFAASAAALVSLSIDIMTSLPALAVVERVITPFRLSASWSATSGLNSLHPNDPNFVSFDSSAYVAMRDDPSRTPLFKKALQDRLNAAPGGPESQTVLDLGTGPFALFAVMAAEMGAGKVYAIEANKDIADNARKVIKELGYDDVITVLDGLSTDVTLPNKEKADVIVAEIVGSIATEEGAYATILDAHKRLLKDPTNDSNWIPNRIQTWCAPASYTLHNLFTPPEFDWTKIAAEPVRFNCRDLGLALLTDPQCIEDISFADINNSKSSNSAKDRKLSFAASEERIEENTGTFFVEYKKGGLPKDEAANLATVAARSCTGIAFWPRLFLPGGSDRNGAGGASRDQPYVISSRNHPDGFAQKSHWQTVLPIMAATPALGIQGGDKIDVVCNFNIPEGVATAPRYSVDAEVFASASVTA
jgi:predicted RNA methylase